MTTDLREKLPVWRLIFLAACMIVVITVEVGPVGVLPKIGADLGAGPTHASLLVSSYAITVVLASVPAIRLLGGFDRRRVLMLSMGAFAASTAILALTHDFRVAVAARVVGGLGHAIFFGAGVDITHRISPARRMVVAVSVFFAGNVVALSLCVPAVAALSEHISWRSVFLVLAGCAALCVAATRLLLPEIRAQHADQPLLPRPDRAALIVCLLGFLWLGGHFLSFTLLRTELAVSGFPDGLAPTLLFVYGVGTVVSTVVAGFVPPERLRGALAVSFALLCCAQAGMRLALPTTWSALLAAAVWGLGFGGVPALNSAAALRYSRVSADLTASMINSACNIGIGAGSFASGLFYRSFGPTAAFIAAAVVFASGVLATETLKERAV